MKVQNVTLEAESLAFKVDLNLLKPDTAYVFSYELDFTIKNKDLGLDFKSTGQGHLKTLGARVTTFVASSCADSQSESEVFEHMLNHKPHFNLMVGDMHYSGHWSNHNQDFQKAYSEMF
jgi:hypothetical protein